MFCEQLPLMCKLAKEALTTQNMITTLRAIDHRITKKYQVSKIDYKLKIADNWLSILHSGTVNALRLPLRLWHESSPSQTAKRTSNKNNDINNKAGISKPEWNIQERPEKNGRQRVWNRQRFMEARVNSCICCWRTSLQPASRVGIWWVEAL